MDEKLKTLLSTYKENKDINSIYKLIDYYYDNNWPMCYKFCTIGLDLDPKNIELHHKTSISAFYAKNKEKALSSTQFLIITKNNYVNNAYSNLKYHDIKLNTKFIKKIEFKSEEDFHPLNPSICKFNDKYYCICRTVNYIYNDRGQMILKDNNWLNLETINYLIIFDNNLNILQSIKLKTNVKCIEDCRLFIWNAKLYFTATTMENVYKKKWIALFNINDNYEIIKIKDFITESNCEKNWLPFINDSNELQIIISHNPLKIMDENMNINIINNNINDSSFRGGAKPIKYENGYLYIIHDSRDSNNLREYYHRFVKTDINLNIISTSGLFKFKNERIEFCGGMDFYEDGLILSFGVMDRETYLTKITFEELNKRLNII